MGGFERARRNGDWHRKCSSRSRIPVKSSTRHVRNSARVAAVIVVLAGAGVHAQQAQGLADLSIQDLPNIEVTSVAEIR